jgi:SpoVK/Ycf46/Vps4 family AAA+-type ATPase
MAKGELLKKLFISYAKGDTDLFQATAMEIIADEEHKNNRVLASALRRSLGSSSVHGSFTVHPAPSRKLEVIPHEKDKQLPLVESVTPERRASEIVLSRVNQQLLLSVLDEFRQRDLIKSHGLRMRSKLLFCGPPGCGKTLCAEVFAHEIRLPLLVANMDTLVSSYLGETASNLRKVFDYAAGRPVVLLLDEFDAIARLRDDEGQHGELKRVVNSLLQLIDRFVGSGFLIAATNQERQLDAAIWRRFDEIVYFDKPDKAQIGRLLKLKFKNFNTEFDPATRADALQGFSHAEIERVCLNSIRRSVLQKRNSVDEVRFQQALELESRRRSIAEQLEGPCFDNG